MKKLDRQFEEEWEGVDGRFWRAEKKGRDIIISKKKRELTMTFCVNMNAYGGEQ